MAPLSFNAFASPYNTPPSSMAPPWTQNEPGFPYATATPARSGSAEVPVRAGTPIHTQFANNGSAFATNFFEHVNHIPAKPARALDLSAPGTVLLITTPAGGPFVSPYNSISVINLLNPQDAVSFVSTCPLTQHLNPVLCLSSGISSPYGSVTMLCAPNPYPS
eukprot:2361841-Rhodomonas_salina.1